MQFVGGVRVMDSKGVERTAEEVLLPAQMQLFRDKLTPRPCPWFTIRRVSISGARIFWLAMSSTHFAFSSSMRSSHMVDTMARSNAITKGQNRFLHNGSASKTSQCFVNFCSLQR